MNSIIRGLQVSVIGSIFFNLPPSFYSKGAIKLIFSRFLSIFNLMLWSGGLDGNRF
jgi:hypothetical protein